jgi:hypothetical protein
LDPALEAFREEIRELRSHPLFAARITGDQLHLAKLSTSDLASLLRNEIAYYFLIAAASLNRTSLRKAVKEPAAQIVPPRQRAAYVVKSRLPIKLSFDSTVAKAVALRAGDFARRNRGAIEQLFRDRLASEGIPLLMSPPIRAVPGLLVPRRKPDGIYPDPQSGLPPKVYLEIKNVQRVADDIQKRLYEIAEASLEMKVLYGRLRLSGLNVRSPNRVDRGAVKLRQRIRAQITTADPKVVALFLCSKVQAERYRAGAETFVDRVFFQEEIDECLAYLKSMVLRARKLESGGRSRRSDTASGRHALRADPVPEAPPRAPRRLD